MLRRFRSHLRQQFIGYLALFVALGGSAYAAATITGADVVDRSLTGVDIKNNSLHARDIEGLRGQDIEEGAIKSSDIKDGTIIDADIDASVFRRGPKGDKGDPGPAGPQGEPGKNGGGGRPGADGRSALTPLGAGETMSGTWGHGWDASSSDTAARGYQSFPIPLSAGVPQSNVVYVAGSSAPNCPGVGQAASGFLCIYQGSWVNADPPTSDNVYNPETGAAGTSRYGFAIYLEAASGGDSLIGGTWTLTG